MPLSTRLALLRASLPPAVSARLVSAAHLPEPRPFLLPTAVPTLDRLLGGGLPRGGLVEITGHPRFTLGIMALAAATGAGESAALVDPGDHLDPQAAAAEGVELARLLWLRPCGLKDALACAETVLDAGFTLVVLDLGISRCHAPGVSRSPRTTPQQEGRSPLRVPEAAWVRLARAASAHETALLVLSPVRASGAAAAAVLTAEEARVRWLSHAPSRPLLLGLSVRLSLEKRRGQRPGESGLVDFLIPGIPKGSSALQFTGDPLAAALSAPERRRAAVGRR